MLNYAMRAIRRAIDRGPVDTVAYSYSVARNAILSAYIDLRYGGKRATTRLNVNAGHPENNTLQHTDWKFLNEIFQQVTIRPDDVLVDVGCGDGRVISYWLSRGCKNKIVGIEIDPDTAEDARRRFSRFPNVTILQGDAADALKQTGGTLLYIFNSFSGETLRRFAGAAREIGAKVIFYSFHDLTPFDGWRIERHLKPGQDRAYRFAVLTPP